ncbi:MAG: diguanylate cyclase [Clostridiales bacterium]|nr:diguanylate cyclase [Clostridiales bacterium]
MIYTGTNELPENRHRVFGGIIIAAKGKKSEQTKYDRYEEILIKLTWALIATMLAYVLIGDVTSYRNSFLSDPSIVISFLKKMLFFAGLFLLHFIKDIIFRKGLLYKPGIYYSNKIIWFFLISFSIIYIDAGIWLYAALLVPITFAALTRGTRPALVITGFSFAIHMLLTIINQYFKFNLDNVIMTDFARNFLNIIFFYIMFAMFAIMFGMIHRNDLENEKENSNLMNQLEDKYFQLEVAQDEIKLQYDRLKTTNKKLEDANLRLSSSIAEFYTLQQISKAINSILDTNELLNYVNDVIIGVMGVNFCSIIISDEKTKRLKLIISNISNIEEKALLADSLNLGFFQSIIDNGSNLIENFADSNKYQFLENRDVASFICVPLRQKDRILGLVLVEHKHVNAFTEENVRLLEIIAQQVGIVMENADLYQKMQDLANRDGLTGAYNRQYFKGKLENEFRLARENEYPLSLAIFDIDLFKKFNDTFGHMFGDLVITTVYKIVVGYLRKHDVIARYGGEEFIMIFPRTNLEQATEKAESLRKLISGNLIRDNLVSASVTASFGVCSYPECVLNEVDLVRMADDALYEAKASGRNCVKTTKRLLE